MDIPVHCLCSYCNVHVPKRLFRSDFVALPFQGAEVLLENLAPLPTMESFSREAASWVEEMTRGGPLVAQVRCALGTKGGSCSTHRPVAASSSCLLGHTVPQQWPSAGPDLEDWESGMEFPATELHSDP